MYHMYVLGDNQNSWGFLILGNLQFDEKCVCLKLLGSAVRKYTLHLTLSAGDRQTCRRALGCGERSHVGEGEGGVYSESLSWPVLAKEVRAWQDVGGKENK